MGKKDLYELVGPGIVAQFIMDEPKLLRLKVSVKFKFTEWMHVEVNEVKELRDSLDAWLEYADPRPSKLQTDMLAWADQMEEESSGVGRLLADELRRRVFESVRK